MWTISKQRINLPAIRITLTSKQFVVVQKIQTDLFNSLSKCTFSRFIILHNHEMKWFQRPKSISQFLSHNFLSNFNLSKLG